VVTRCACLTVRRLSCAGGVVLTLGQIRGRLVGAGALVRMRRLRAGGARTHRAGLCWERGFARPALGCAEVSAERVCGSAVGALMFCSVGVVGWLQSSNRVALSLEPAIAWARCICSGSRSLCVVAGAALRGCRPGGRSCERCGSSPRVRGLHVADLVRSPGAAGIPSRSAVPRRTSVLIACLPYRCAYGFAEGRSGASSQPRRRP